jgi:putative ABC transport system substrate-binding protein
MPDVEASARAFGLQLVLMKAATAGEFDGAFSQVVQSGAGGMLVSGGPFFTSQRRALVALTGAYRQAGVYAGKILSGAKPSELPVLQPTTFSSI